MIIVSYLFLFNRWWGELGAVVFLACNYPQNLRIWNKGNGEGVFL